MFKKILFPIFLISLVSCHPSNKPATVKNDSEKKEIPVFDPRSFGDNKITLSEVADDISYISLDSIIPLGIGNIGKYFLTEKNIFLYDRITGILKFDRSGKLLNKIGEKGRGPGEYNFVQSFTVDEKTGNVYVLEESKLKTYTSSGRFLRDITYDRDLLWLGNNIEIFNSKIFIADYVVMGNSKNVWIILDTLGKVLSKKVNSLPSFSTTIGISGNVYMFDNNLYYFNRYNDTIFRISENFSSSPAYLFAKGDFRIPAGPPEKNLGDYFMPVKMIETSKYTFLPYDYKKERAIVVIDKKSSKVFNIPSLLNDIDGGMSFNSYKYYLDKKSNNEFLYLLVEAKQINQHLSSEQFEESKNSQKKKEFEVMASKIDEMDNPVLMIVRLKK